MSADAERFEAEELEIHIRSCHSSWLSEPSEDGSYVPMTEEEASQQFDRWLDLHDAQIAAERDAEKERAQEDYTNVWRQLRLVEAERDALPARIEAVWDEGHQAGYLESATGQRYSNPYEAAALAGDQPEATPEPDDIPGGCIYCSSSGIVEDYEGDRPCSACDGTGTPRLREATPETCMNTIGPSSNGGRWGACSLPEGHWRDGSDCRDESAPEPETWRDRQGDVWTLGNDGLMHTRETAPFAREHVEKKWGPLVPVYSTPEPPHLDPEPWVSLTTGLRYAKSVGVFAPRPADENGKRYSKNREEYP